MKIWNALIEDISIAFGNDNEEAEGFLHLKSGESGELPDTNFASIQKKVERK